MISSSDSTSKGFVKYTSRDYASILADLRESVPALTELWKPDADADPGMVFGKWLASVADMLGVNVDWLANEVYAPTTSQRKNAEKVLGLCGYRLGWYTAARTEVTLTNISENPITVDLSFNGSNFSTLNAYTDITGQSRVITYNVIPGSHAYTDQESRATRTLLNLYTDVFDSSDVVTLGPSESLTRVAIEGELRQVSVSVKHVKENNYIINLPSQHVDTTAVWLRARPSRTSDTYTRWIQCESPSDFIEPEPRFAVTYDSYSNAQIQVSNYLDELENYDGSIFTVYWLDCSGVIGSVGEDVLSNFLPASVDDNTDASVYTDSIQIHNLSNTVEIPHTYTVTGKSPETAHEAYLNSRNYINTFDSLVTLPDYTRFLNREAGVDCGTVLDCQKALDLNRAIYKDRNLTATQKQLMYITNNDFPKGDMSDADLSAMLSLSWDLDTNTVTDMKPISNFKPYTAVCYAIHNDFNDTQWGQGQWARAQISSTTQYMQYMPPVQFIANIIKDYKPLQSMAVSVEFGAVRVFPFYVVGTIYPKKSMTQARADLLVATVKEALSLYFAPSNRRLGQYPTLMEVVTFIQSVDPLIAYFDAGNLANSIITWKNCDIRAFNPISFARYMPTLATADSDIQVSPEYID